MNLIILLISQLIGIVVAVTIHQFFYAFASTKLGDPIPKKEGRLTLNPLKHIELVGFIILIIRNFGWGNPVNTNPAYYKDKKKGTILVALSGIISNFLIAAIFGLLYNSLAPILLSTNAMLSGFVLSTFRYIVKYNVVLAVSNLVPIYPMDGYKILLSFVKPSTYYKLIQYEKIIQMIVIFLVFMGITDIILGPINNLLIGLFM